MKIERYTVEYILQEVQWVGWRRTSIIAKSSSLNYNKNRSVKPGFPFPIHSHFILLGIDGPWWVYFFNYKKWLIYISFNLNFGYCCHDVKLISGFNAFQVNHGFITACHLNFNSSTLKAPVQASVNLGVVNLCKMWAWYKAQEHLKNSNEKRVLMPIYIIKLNETGNKR